MTTPIQTQTPVPLPAKRDWCCNTPITGPHVPGCAYEPREAVPEPPAPDPQPGPAPAASVASEPRRYGFKRRPEFDLELPTGAYVRVRQLSFTQAMDLGVLDMGDLFGPELLKRLNDGDEEATAESEVGRALLDKDRRAQIMDPLDRVLIAVVLCPRVVLDGESDDEQMNVKDIDLIEKAAIFNATLPDELKPAALEEQHDALKSVHTAAEGVRGVPDGEAIRAETE